MKKRPIANDRLRPASELPHATLGVPRNAAAWTGSGADLTASRDAHGRPIVYVTVGSIRCRYFVSVTWFPASL